MTKTARDKSDRWTLEARRRGYPARSIFKLEEIERKFRIFKSARTILDVGAAPGSWSLYVSREILKGEGKIVSADLNPLSLSPMPENIKEVTGDAFAPENLETIRSEGIYDVVISDAAPHTSGNRNVDVARSEEIVCGVIKLCDEVLKPHGNMIAKIFQGGGCDGILKSLRLKFEKICTYKPQVCRSDSFETYIIAIGRNSD